MHKLFEIHTEKHYYTIMQGNVQMSKYTIVHNPQ